MNKKQSILKVDSILEYYDNPQLLTARDCFDTLVFVFAVRRYSRMQIYGNSYFQ